MDTNVELSPLYLFLDEGGNLDFTSSGTKFFTLTSVTTIRPFNYVSQLDTLKHDLLESKIDLTHFHATDDRQAVRNQFFNILQQQSFSIDSIIIEKSKVELNDILKFYFYALEHLFQIITKNLATELNREVIVITDSLPIQKKRKAFEKSIKMALANMPIKFHILHHPSKTNFGLQIADYCNWAIYRKWAGNDLRSYELIKDKIRTEIEIPNNDPLNYPEGRAPWALIIEEEPLNVSYHS